MRSKDMNTILPRLNFIPSFLTLLPSPLVSNTAWMGNRGCSESIMLYFYLSFLLTLFAFSDVFSCNILLHELFQCGNFPESAVFQELLQHGSFSWVTVLKNGLLHHGPLMDCCRTLLPNSCQVIPIHVCPVHLGMVR